MTTAPREYLFMGSFIFTLSRQIIRLPQGKRPTSSWICCSRESVTVPACRRVSRLIPGILPIKYSPIEPARERREQHAEDQRGCRVFQDSY